MSKISFFDVIPLSEAIDERAMRRMGYNEKILSMTSAQKDEIAVFFGQARQLIKLQGSAMRIDIMRWSDESVQLATGIGFSSKALAGMLKGCSQVLLLGATAGAQIVETIRLESSANPTRAVVLDAYASEAVDHALGWIMEYFAQQVMPEGKRVIYKRFSAGYADFALDNQQIICNALLLARYGVRLTPEHILAPEKTVTAVSGIISRSAVKKVA
jgi:hypothetical protein